MSTDNTQWVCTTQPMCACVGDQEDPTYQRFSCDCTAAYVKGSTKGVCIDCRRPMVLIDADSGNPIEAQAS